MSVQLERLDGGRVALEVEVPAPEVEQALDRAYRKLVGSVNVPGFRRGRAPRRVVERLLGRDRLWQDAVDPLVATTLGRAARDAGVEAVDTPEIEGGAEVPAPETPFHYRAAFTAKPEVQLGDYRAIRVSRQEDAVGPAEVTAALEDLREARARWVPVEDGDAEDGMLVVVDMAGTVDDAPVPPERGVSGILGGGSLRPEVEDALRGLRPGQERGVDIAFPADDADRKLAGKSGHFTINLRECKRKQLPDVNDDFAREVADVATVDELRNEIERSLQRRAAERADEAAAVEARDQAVTQATFEVPDIMVEQQLDRSVRELDRRLQQSGSSVAAYLEQRGQSLAELRDEGRAEALRQVKTRLVLEAVARVEACEPTEDELRRRIEEMAGAYGSSAASVRRLLLRPENTAEVRADLRLEKAGELLRVSALQGAPDAVAGETAQAGAGDGDAEAATPATPAEQAGEAAPEAAAATAGGKKAPARKPRARTAKTASGGKPGRTADGAAESGGSR